MVVSALALALAWPAVPATAAGPGIVPAAGSYLTSDTVTVNAWGSSWGGTLTVDGVRRGGGPRLSYTIDGHQVANGWHHAALTSGGGYQNGPWGGPSGSWTIESNFQMAVPPYAPSGVSVSARGSHVSVGWNRGGEPDLTGYSVSSKYGTVWVPASCANGRCGTSIKVPARAKGDLAVSVVANRVGSGPSGPAGASVRLIPARPKPRKNPTPSVSAQASSPGGTASEKAKDTAEQPAPQPSESLIPPVLGSSDLSNVDSTTEVTPVASLHSEGNTAISRLIIAWIIVFVFGLVLVGAHFYTAANRGRRRRAALLREGQRSRHRRQLAAPRSEPEIILERTDTVRLSLPGGRTGASAESESTYFRSEWT
jgi:hypothetical protein